MTFIYAFVIVKLRFFSVLFLYVLEIQLYIIGKLLHVLFPL